MNKVYKVVEKPGVLGLHLLFMNSIKRLGESQYWEGETSHQLRNLDLNLRSSVPF